MQLLVLTSGADASNVCRYFLTGNTPRFRMIAVCKIKSMRLKSFLLQQWAEYIFGMFGRFSISKKTTLLLYKLQEICQDIENDI